MQKEITQTRFFPQPPQEVWEYLTKPELMELWLMRSDFQPVVGHKFRFTHVPKNESSYAGIIEGEVLEVIPVARLSYSWNGRTKDRSRAFNSNVVWTLTPKGNGTELQLQHNGFTLQEDSDAHDTGWSVCLLRLQERLTNKVQLQ